MMTSGVCNSLKPAEVQTLLNQETLLTPEAAFLRDAGPWLVITPYGERTWGSQVIGRRNSDQGLYSSASYQSLQMYDVAPSSANLQDAGNTQHGAGSPCLDGIQIDHPGEVHFELHYYSKRPLDCRCYVGIFSSSEGSVRYFR
jgi:hypothetical protein